jgi:AraC-like DNA-binding protein
MTVSGTAAFTNPDEYRAGIGLVSVSLVLTGRGEFRASLTWLKLRHLHLLYGRENMARIAYMALPPARAFVSFPIGRGVPLTWNGLALQPGDIVVHSRGERMHQWSRGVSRWGLASLPATQLAARGSAGRVLRPSPTAAARLRRLQMKACDFAKRGPQNDPHAAEVLERELTDALVDCLTAPEAAGNSTTKRRHAQIMNRLEDALSERGGRQPSLPELCAALGVPERTLRACCVEFLGLSPGRYLRLRRLNLARAALRQADPAMTGVAEIARRYQFSELGRFAADYRAVFGETPSATLRGVTTK